MSKVNYFKSLNLNLSQIMLHALKCAEQGRGLVEPNPMVAALLLYKGEIVAEAFHNKYGAAHAERLVIDQLDGRVPIQECTLVVTLEPCSHFGKTAPCADYIIEKGIRHVIIAAADPNPRVKGMGIAKLKSAGIKVELGYAEQQARKLNAEFYRLHESKRPYITLKWAESADGFMAAHSVSGTPVKTAISGNEANAFVHTLRARHEALLIGKQTLLIDNPELTVRHVVGKNPVRVIWCTNADVDSTLHVFNSKASTVFIKNGYGTSDATHWYLQNNLPKALDVAELLYTCNIQSVLIEGGAKVLQQFIAEGLANRIVKIVNPELFLKKGVKAPPMQITEKPYKLGKDLIYDIKYRKSSS